MGQTDPPPAMVHGCTNMHSSCTLPFGMLLYFSSLLCCYTSKLQLYYTRSAFHWKMPFNCISPLIMNFTKKIKQVLQFEIISYPILTTQNLKSTLQIKHSVFLVMTPKPKRTSEEPELQPIESILTDSLDLVPIHHLCVNIFLMCRLYKCLPHEMSIVL